MTPKEIWNNLGDLALQMAVISQRNIEFYEDDPDEVKHWSEKYDVWFDRLADWLHQDSIMDEEMDVIPMPECYLDALELIHEAREYGWNVDARAD